MMKATRSRRYDRSNAARPPGWRTEFTAWLSALLVVINVLAGAALPPRAANAASISPDQSLFGQIEICTDRGMITLGADGNPVPESRQHHGAAALCSFCLPLLHAGTAPADAPVIVTPSARSQGALPVAMPRQVRPLRLVTAAFPRAPPIDG